KSELVHRSDVSSSVDLSKLPADASQLLRIVKVGDYDICACIGSHVNNTSEIGTFRITTYTYDSDSRVLRIRFKLDNRK
ncbi:MAG: alanine-tRNA synthetase second additional domain-containing protein, partial [Bacteroidales bacterium]|nr:alanine-tRNA synthetase second additional domain-containing protein [Bacteroidales bacterium]